jgi:hypothetical protein
MNIFVLNPHCWRAFALRGRAMGLDIVQASALYYFTITTTVACGIAMAFPHLRPLSFSLARLLGGAEPLFDEPGYVDSPVAPRSAS